MKSIWVWICIITLGILPLILAVLSFFYRSEWVEFLTSQGWDKLAGFISGPWWTNSIPALILVWGVVGAIWQINETRKSTKAQLVVEVFHELRDPKTVETLREIYELTQDECRNVPTEKGKKIDHIIVTM